MRRFIPLAIVALALLAAAATQAAPAKFVRYPHVHGNRLAFAYHGDLWVANLDGSNPARLTAHVSRNTFPRFSPDGRWIAFTSNRMGNDDVWVIPSSGGEARQLTFLSTGDSVLYWTPDGKRVLFSTNRGARAFGSPLVQRAGRRGAPRTARRWTVGELRDDHARTAGCSRSTASAPATGARATRGTRPTTSGRSGPEDEGLHAAHRHRPQGVPRAPPEPLPDVGRRRDDLLRLRARRHVQHLEGRAGRRRAGAGDQPQEGRRPVPVHQPGRQDDRLRERVRAVDAGRAGRHARRRSPSTWPSTRRRTWSSTSSPRARRTASTRRPTATTWRSTSTARSSSCRPTPRSARSGR